jgi:hypothetical protein
VDLAQAVVVQDPEAEEQVREAAAAVVLELAQERVQVSLIRLMLETNSC